MNISSFGDRKKLFLAIENLKNTATSISNESQPKKEQQEVKNDTVTEESEKTPETVPTNQQTSNEIQDTNEQMQSKRTGPHYRMSILSPSDKGMQKKITTESDKSKQKKGFVLVFQ